MSKNKSPREWTIQRFEDAYNYYENVEGPNTGENALGIESVKVIERAAFDALAAELTASNARFADLAAAANLANAKLAAAEKERDYWRECHKTDTRDLSAKLQAERERAEDLAKKWQDMWLERDQARAECERLRALGSGL